MKKYAVRIFDGVFTRVYTTEAKTMPEAETKVFDLHRFTAKTPIIKVTTTELP